MEPNGTRVNGTEIVVDSRDEAPDCVDAGQFGYLQVLATDQYLAQLILQVK